MYTLQHRKMKVLAQDTQLTSQQLLYLFQSSDFRVCPAGMKPSASLGKENPSRMKAMNLPVGQYFSVDKRCCEWEGMPGPYLSLSYSSKDHCSELQSYKSHSSGQAYLSTEGTGILVWRSEQWNHPLQATVNLSLNHLAPYLLYPVSPSPPSFLIFLASGPTVKSLPPPSNLRSSVLWPPHWSPCLQPLPTWIWLKIVMVLNVTP